MNRLSHTAGVVALCIAASLLAQSTQPTTAPALQPAAPGSMPPGCPMLDSQGVRYIPIPAYPPQLPYGIAPAYMRETPPDVEQQASCVVQVNAASALSGRSDINSVPMLLSSTSLCNPVIRKTLDLPAGSLGKLVFITAQMCGGNMVRIDVSLKKTDKPYAPGAADALLAALTDRLRAALQQSAQADAKTSNAQLQSIADALDASRKKLAEISDSNRETRELISTSGSPYEDPQSVIQNLRSQKRQIESELSRLKARQAALEPEKGAQDAVTAWEAAIDGQTMAVARAEALLKEGKGDLAKLTEAQTKLAQAKSQLAAARQQANTPTDQSRYNQSEMRNLKTQIAEQEQRLKPIQEQLAKLDSPAVAAKLSAYRDNQQEEQRLRNEVSECTQRLMMLQRTLRDRGELTITVIDGQPK